MSLWIAFGSPIIFVFHTNLTRIQFSIFYLADHHPNLRQHTQQGGFLSPSGFLTCNISFSSFFSLLPITVLFPGNSVRINVPFFSSYYISLSMALRHSSDCLSNTTLHS